MCIHLCQMPVFNLKSPDMKECHATRLLITVNISVGVIDRDRLTCHDTGWSLAQY